MRGYQQRLYPASLGSVQFGVEVAEQSGGRRVGVHVFPRRDTPLVEDLGRKPKVFTIEAFLVGDDYRERTDRLVRSLEGTGPGGFIRPGRCLQHPSLGVMRVICQSYSVREAFVREGRMARVSMDFIEVGEVLAPTRRGGSQARIADRATEVGAASQAEVVADAKATGVPETVREASASRLRELSTRLARLNVFSGPQAEVAALQASVTQLTTQASELATAPANLAVAVGQALERIIDASLDVPENALAAYESLFAFPPVALGGTSQAAVDADRNSALVAQLVTATAVAQGARAAALVSFESFEDAAGARDRVAAGLDAIAGDVSDDTYDALQDLRRELVAGVPAPEQDLPRQRETTLPANRSALVVAWENYEDVGREPEIVARNRIPHPGRVPGGKPLVLLTS